MMLQISLAALLSWAVGCHAGPEIARETFSVLGWNKACSVAIAHYGYPFLGKAAQEEPIFTRIGAWSIAPGEEAATVSWSADWQGRDTWNKAQAKKVLQSLTAAGYDQSGFPETLRTDAPELLRSTEAFALRSLAGWPESGWTWQQLHYSPLDQCGLFVFVKADSPRPLYRYALLRLYNPAARGLRAEAHAAQARALLDKGDLPGALEEASVAALMDPLHAASRYQHAALLCLAGRFNEAEAELAAAVKLDARLRSQARADRDFEAIFSSRRFQAITRSKP